MKKWPKSRITELEQLNLLLREVDSIDNANHVLARLQLITKIANKLLKSDIRRGRQNFMQFLINECYGPPPSKP